MDSFDEFCEEFNQIPIAPHFKEGADQGILQALWIIVMNLFYNGKCLEVTLFKHSDLTSVAPAEAFGQGIE
jgi:hypothetical protein